MESTQDEMNEPFAPEYHGGYTIGQAIADFERVWEASIDRRLIRYSFDRIEIGSDEDFYLLYEFLIGGIHPAITLAIDTHEAAPARAVYIAALAASLFFDRIAAAGEIDPRTLRLEYLGQPDADAMEIWARDFEDARHESPVFAESAPSIEPLIIPSGDDRYERAMGRMPMAPGVDGPVAHAA